MFSFTFLILLVSIASTGATSQRLLLQQDRDVTVSELSKHSTYDDDLWISLKGIVYDVTSFEHPGGSINILKVGGIDGTDIYREEFDKGVHPYRISEVVQKYDTIVRIGPLVDKIGRASCRERV